VPGSLVKKAEKMPPFCFIKDATFGHWFQSWNIRNCQIGFFYFFIDIKNCFVSSQKVRCYDAQRKVMDNIFKRLCYVVYKSR
jgi:hypothetical protein